MSSEWITNRRRAQGRLPRLASWLREVSGHVNGARFHLDVFREQEYPYEDQPKNIQEAKRCGFEGCALGWATVNPWFRKAGLRLEYQDGEWLPYFGAIEEAADFFGIYEEAAEFIFGDSDVDWRDGGPVEHYDFGEGLNPEDPIAAAERIERFCVDNGIPLEGAST